MSTIDLDVRLHIRCDRHAPAVVRTSLQRVGGLGWPLGDAMLVSSELVTNAVRHSGARPDKLIEVRVWVEGERLRISVRDPGERGEVILRSDEEPGGMGLRIVEELALRWGAERDGGHRVWAELPVAGIESFTA